MQRILKIHPDDNVAAALTDLAAGTTVEVAGQQITLTETIPVKHKFTLEAVPVSGAITMYGVLVGRARQPMPAGKRLRTENVEHAAQEYAEQGERTTWTAPDIRAWKGRTFMGYHRSDGQVGTRNYWLVLPLVFCENRNIRVIQQALNEQLGYATERQYRVGTERLLEAYRNGANADELLAADILLDAREQAKNRPFPNVDGIKYLTHEGGCGGTRQDSETLCRLFATYLTHPNVAGATVLSLGCQNAQYQSLQRALQRINPAFSKPLYFLEQQQSRSERDYIAEAVKRTFVGLTMADEITRRPAPVSKLVLGLECGGSDGFSGISANPALGYASDLLVALGGATVLSEFPELNGVEQELINRCQSASTANKFSQLMRTYAARAEAVGSGFKNNPSPGNIRDGLITDAMKSAGAAKKGGTSPVVEVLDYTETVQKPGLHLLCTPGNDVESTTGLAGAGCNLIVFTTGLGTPTGNPVSPVVKFSSNTALSERMTDLIDLDAGTIITGTDTIETKGAELLDLLIQTASGDYQTRAERLGQDDFIPWKRGVSL